MEVQVQYQGLEPSTWVEEFVSVRISKLERFVGPSSSVGISFKVEQYTYTTTLSVHGLFKTYTFSGKGENLYESFSSAMDTACRDLSEHQKRMKTRKRLEGDEINFLEF